MNEPVFLTVDDVIYLHKDQIDRYGGTHGIRDNGLLSSAVEAPKATFGGALILKSISIQIR